MMHRKILVFILMITFSSHLHAFGRHRTQPQKVTTPKSTASQPDTPYGLTPPKGWQCISDKEQLPGKVELVYIGHGQAGQFIPSVNLALEETSLPLEEYVSLAKEYHETQGETICTRLGNIETQEGTAQIIQIDRKTGWGDVRFIQASAIQNGVAYVITATCLKEDFSSYCAPFFKAIQSFTINKEYAINEINDE